MTDFSTLVPVERIEKAILLIRGQKVILDRDLATLYGVETKNLNKAVRRNRDRFPSDFMFRHTLEEARTCRASRFQFGTLKRGQNIKYLPHAFTEQGIVMLSSVLNSPRAVRVNIEIMRAFVRLRQLLASHADLARKLDELEAKCDARFQVVFKAIRQLLKPPKPRRDSPKRQIGFQAQEGRAVYRVRKREAHL